MIDKLRDYLWHYLGSTEETRSKWWLPIRSFFHLILGAAIGLVGRLLIHGGFPRLPTAISLSIVWGFLVILKEIHEDDHQPWYKTIADCGSMIGGFAVTMWWPDL